ncbi:hypothetical protein ABFS82_14G096700 [Erythranthe guttata]|uniref:metacaspase-1-like isoform X2 n=1 Tax=Erythranthe guttata TaxID=4155 RepID=UPI00064D7A33|nr:PREDICTED: metacaspase-1-like isoform X2 [Erythranthe guttata]|eukprot:XP_012835412.1 PREDICTED: metacaspase-1-like isoform X2 [Erythranthe guttata]
MAEAKRLLSYNNGKKNSVNRYRTSGSSSFSEQPPRGKRALLCCVSYRNQKFELKGTTHDLKNMRSLLVEQFRFPLDAILILAEKERYSPPTRKNIEDGFQWLMRGIQPGDSLVFYFSGHGLRQRGLHGDEIDGYDETICPLDFQTNGMILDNYINTTLVRPLIRGVTLHAIIDSCHSGTVLDLPLVYNMNTRKWDDNSPRNEESSCNKGTNGGKAISISACQDYQQAADTSAFSPEKKNMTGAMTCIFVRAVKGGAASNNGKKITYQGILDHMHQSLNQEEKVSCVGAGFRRALRRKIFQDPLLSSSEEFDTETEFKL